MMKSVSVLFCSLAILSLLGVVLKAQEKQQLDDVRFKIKTVHVELANGNRLSFPMEEFGGLMCGKGSAGLTVFWLTKKKQGEVQYYETESQEYFFRRQLKSDHRIRKNAESKGEDKTDPLLDLEYRLLSLIHI